MKNATRSQVRSSLPPGWRLAARVFLVAFTAVTLLPLAWMAYSSFKPQAEIMLRPIALPEAPTLQNYADAWRIGNMGTAIVNSLIYTGLSTVLTVVLSLAAGFALAKFGYAGARVYYSVFTLGLLITMNSVITPLFIMETRLGMYNTHAGVILPYIAFSLPTGVLLATAYHRSLPESLIEAALIDGASYLRIFWDIIVVVSSPVMATIAVLTFLHNWNDFLLVFTLTSGDNMRSLPVSINFFAGRLNVNYGMQLAALVIGTIPMIFFYSAAHKVLIAGFGDGALKE